MSRVEVVGPRGRFQEVLTFLQGRGVLELRAPEAPASIALHHPALGTAAGEDARLLATMQRIDGLLARLPPAGTAPSEPLPPPGSDAFGAAIAGLEAEAEALDARRSTLAAERAATERLLQLVQALPPSEYALPAEASPEFHALVLQTDPEALALLDGEVRKRSRGACQVRAAALDAHTTGVLLVVPAAAGRAVTALLSDRGVEEARLPPAYAGKTVEEQVALLGERSRALPGEVAAAQADLEVFAARARPVLADARLQASAARARIRAAAECGETRFAFVIGGYVPAPEVPALRAASTAEFGDAVAVFARPPGRGEWGDVPVVLRNRPNVRPFERLLALVPLPRYGTVDPTPWLALFFPLLFGLILGDLAFGVLGVVAALLVRRRARGQAARDLATVAFWCSLSAAVFGVLFGEALGELGAHVGIHPLLLDRRHGFMAFLALALAVGGVHVVVGMALGLASHVRARRVRAAVGRAASLALLVSVAAVVGCLAGALPRAALEPLLVAGALSLVVAVVAAGPLAALDVVLGLGSVLSYSRLMALGLASVMLAEVANAVARDLDPPAAGLTLAVLLHAVNFSLGLVSPTIAALRLQYVEFFDKFYDEGGAPFRPFASR